jgi:Ca2+-binding EF-hand superfamily protein
MPTVRLTRCHIYLLVGLLLAVVGPMVLSQDPGPPGGFGRGGFGKGGFGKGGFGRGGMMDPTAFWDQIAQGKDSVNVNEVQFPPQMAFFADRIRERWSNFLQTKGVTNGIMTKELYLEQSEQARARFGGGKFGPPGGGAGGAGDSKEDAAKQDDEARRMFAFLDRNKDGVIDREEASQSRTLRDFDRWDLNKDGKISVDEYIEAHKAEQARRMGGRGGPGGGGGGGGAVITDEVQEEERKAVVYRAGNLPKELPPWFAQLDTDNDGQVGLYEWKAAGRPIIEFLSMDANGDGLLTVEEVLRFQRMTNKDKPQSPGQNGPAVAQGEQGNGAAPAAGAPDQGGGRMQRGPGRGGRGGQGGPGGGRGGRGGQGGGRQRGGRGGPGGGFGPPGGGM